MPNRLLCTTVFSAWLCAAPAFASMPAPGAAAHPLWTELAAPQQHALQPLAGEWDGMERARKEKWLQVASRFDAMTPQAQQRLQERMRKWASLTPEQRRLARENYARTRHLHPSQRAAQWQHYQQLPEEQKKKLAASHAAQHRSGHAANPTPALPATATSPARPAANTPNGK